MTCLQSVFAHKILEIVLLLPRFCSLGSAESMSYFPLISANLFLREPLVMNSGNDFAGEEGRT